MTAVNDLENIPNLPSGTYSDITLVVPKLGSNLTFALTKDGALYAVTARRRWFNLFRHSVKDCRTAAKLLGLPYAQIDKQRKEYQVKEAKQMKEDELEIVERKARALGYKLVKENP